jgi:DNA polymerase
LETKSDINLKTCGMFKYCESNQFKILLAAYAIGDGPVELISLADGDDDTPLCELLEDPNNLFYAHNAQFEWLCLNTWLKNECKDQVDWIVGTTEPYLPISRFRCSMALARFCGYPGSLADACGAIELPFNRQKDANGKELIKLFCKPDGKGYNNHKEFANLWRTFREYCKQDVEAERALLKALPLRGLTPDEQFLWELDAAINSRGLYVDGALLTGACTVNEKVQMVAEITSHMMFPELAKPRNPVEFVERLRKRGVDIPDAKTKTVEQIDLSKLDPDFAKAIVARHEMTRSSIAKYEVMEGARCLDGRVRGALMYYGAGRTGRWSGRIFQPQNLPKITVDHTVLDWARTCIIHDDYDGLLKGGNTLTPADALSQCLRTAITTPPFRKLVVADYSSIEARITAWLAGEDWQIQQFHDNVPVYEATASAMFNVPIEKIVKGNEEYSFRALGKVATLACGFGGGLEAFRRLGGGDLGMTVDEMLQCVFLWRKAHPCVKTLWYTIAAAAEDVSKGAPAVRLGQRRGLEFRLEPADRLGHGRKCLTIKLPSGRKLRYIDPVVEYPNGHADLSYMGQAGDVGKWTRQRTFGGKLTENIVQGIARDLLACALGMAEDDGLNPVMHVHDEIICDVREECAEDCLHNLIQIMCEMPDWAKGLPLAAEGAVYDYYCK